MDNFCPQLAEISCTPQQGGVGSNSTRQLPGFSTPGGALIVLEMRRRRRELRAALVMCPKNHS